MQARLRESYLEMANDNQAIASPVGEAFKYSRMADSTINLYSTDNSHPSVAGTYLAACTFYATIFETSPVGLSYTAGLNTAQAAFLQQIAYQTVFDSLSVWNINEFEPQANFIYTANGSDPYTYQFTSTSTNANSYLWSEGATTTSFTHTFAGAGVYTISLIVSNGCTIDTVSQEILVSPFSTLTENKADLFTLNYQNQTLHFNFASIPQAPICISIFDALGKQIYQNSNISNQTENINTSQWNKGIYFVEFRNKSQVITKKISIE
jgi:PKD repeat protein